MIMDAPINDNLINFVRNRIVSWYKRRGRKNLYWRKHTDPYTILIAEILLKRTRAETVAPYIVEFLKKYPNLRSLAEAPLEDIINALKPLGLHKQRALHIKELANTIVSKYCGEIPNNYDELIKLPGIGEYIANAVLCFAFRKGVPLVDTNTTRIILRFFGIRPSRSEARRSPEIWEIAREITPKNGEQAREIWWGMIDLAALVCTPKNPKCLLCPLKERCNYHTQLRNSTKGLRA